MGRDGYVRPGGRTCENGEHDPYPLNENFDACHKCDIRWIAMISLACKVCGGSQKMNIGDRKVELDDCDACDDGYAKEDIQDAEV